jgi:hypothetical protein
VTEPAIPRLFCLRSDLRHGCRPTSRVGGAGLGPFCSSAEGVGGATGGPPPPLTSPTPTVAHQDEPKKDPPEPGHQRREAVSAEVVEQVHALQTGGAGPASARPGPQRNGIGGVTEGPPPPLTLPIPFQEHQHESTPAPSRSFPKGEPRSWAGHQRDWGLSSRRQWC